MKAFLWVIIMWYLLSDCTTFGSKWGETPLLAEPCVQGSWVPDRLSYQLLYGGTKYIWVFSKEPVSCHFSGTLYCEADHKLFKNLCTCDLNTHYTWIWIMQSSVMWCYVVWYKCTKTAQDLVSLMWEIQPRWWRQQDTITSEDTCTRLVMTSDELGLWSSREHITMRTSYLVQEKKFQVFLCIWCYENVIITSRLSCKVDLTLFQHQYCYHLIPYC